MKLFLTSYVVGGYHYGAYVTADHLGEARAVVGRRGLNECIEGEVDVAVIPNQLATLIAQERWAEAAHEACFLSFVGLSSGALTAREVVGDKGLVHELLHLALLRPDPPGEAPDIVAENEAERVATIAAVRSMARDFEFRVPGHAPTFLPAHQEEEAKAPFLAAISKAPEEGPTQPPPASPRDQHEPGLDRRTRKRRPAARPR